MLNGTGEFSHTIDQSGGTISLALFPNNKHLMTGLIYSEKFLLQTRKLQYLILKTYGNILQFFFSFVIKIVIIKKSHKK